MPSSPETYSETLLGLAAEAGDKGQVLALLQNTSPRVEINARNPDCQTPLMRAAKIGHSSVVKLLLEHGADPTERDHRSLDALWYAVRAGHTESVAVLLQNGKALDINQQYWYSDCDDRHKNDVSGSCSIYCKTRSDTPLSVAIARGYIDVAYLLLHEPNIDPLLTLYGTDLKSRDINENAIGLAIRLHEEELALRMLSMFSCQISRRKDAKELVSNLLFYAARVGSIGLAETLLEKPFLADPNILCKYNFQSQSARSSLSESIRCDQRLVALRLIKTKLLLPDVICSSLLENSGSRIVQSLLRIEDVRAVLNWKDSNGDTLLSLAVQKYDTWMVHQLLLLPPGIVDVDSRDTKGRTPLINTECILFGCNPDHYEGQWQRNVREVAQMLLQSGRANPHARDQDGISLPYHLAEYGMLSMLQLFIDPSSFQLDLNADVGQGATLLTLAASRGHRDVVQALLNTGRVDVNRLGIHTCDRYPPERAAYTALSLAAMSLHLSSTHQFEDVANLLLAQPNIEIFKRNGNGSTALSMASTACQPDILKKILKVSTVADVNATDSQGRTALHYAISSSADKCLEELLQFPGIDADVADHRGRTPLSIACKRSKTQVVKALLAHPGVNPDSRDHTGRTPLSWAICPKYGLNTTNVNEGLLIAWKLVALGAEMVDCHAEDSTGMTPLLRAIECPYAVLFTRQLLNLNSLDVNRRCHDGRTPLAAAKLTGNVELVELLLSKGARDSDNALAAKNEIGDDGTPNKGNVGSNINASVPPSQSGQQVDKQRDGVLDESNLCSRCAALDVESIFLKDYTEGYEIISSLGPYDKKWLTGPCDLCRMIATMARFDRIHCLKQHPFLLVAFSSRYLMTAVGGGSLTSWNGRRQDNFKKDWTDSVILGVLQTQRPIPRPRRLLCTGYIGLASPKFNHEQQSIGIQQLGPSSSMDFDLVQEWISQCCTNHKTRECNTSQDSLKRIPHFFLIDCQTRHILPFSGAQPEFLALSYVWGPRPTPGSDAAIEEKAYVQHILDGDKNQTYRCLRPAAEGGVEAVVEDALRVTDGLGHRYLWVDRYCVDQAHTSSIMETQLKHVHAVYQNAVLTLVMATGSDAKAGLAGANGRRDLGDSRRMSVAPQLTARIHGQLLTCIPPYPSQLIESSTWATRGWTYQEGIFARRRLFFGAHELSYECNGMTCREAIRVSERVQRHMSQFSAGPNAEDSTPCFPDRFLYRHCVTNAIAEGGHDLVKHLSLYTARQLTFESDILNAMLGILEAYSSRYSAPVYNISGVPALLEEMHPLPWSLRGKINDMMEKEDTMSRARAVVVSNTEEINLAKRGFLAALLWELRQSGTRRPGYPSWSWAGWRGRVAPTRFHICAPSDRLDVGVSIVVRPSGDRTGQIEAAAGQDDDSTTSHSVDSLPTVDKKDSHQPKAPSPTILSWEAFYRHHLQPEGTAASPENQTTVGSKPRPIVEPYKGQIVLSGLVVWVTVNKAVQSVGQLNSRPGEGVEIKPRLGLVKVNKTVLRGLFYPTLREQVSMVESSGSNLTKDGKQALYKPTSMAAEDLFETPLPAILLDHISSMFLVLQPVKVWHGEKLTNPSSTGGDIDNEEEDTTEYWERVGTFKTNLWYMDPHKTTLDRKTFIVV